jgi:hypothetical protein
MKQKVLKKQTKFLKQINGKFSNVGGADENNK